MRDLSGRVARPNRQVRAQEEEITDSPTVAGSPVSHLNMSIGISIPSLLYFLACQLHTIIGNAHIIAGFTISLVFNFSSDLQLTITVKSDHSISLVFLITLRRCRSDGEGKK